MILGRSVEHQQQGQRGYSKLGVDLGESEEAASAGGTANCSINADFFLNFILEMQR